MRPKRNPKGDKLQVKGVIDEHPEDWSASDMYCTRCNRTVFARGSVNGILTMKCDCTDKQGMGGVKMAPCWVHACIKDDPKKVEEEIREAEMNEWFD